jgi:hypothetical protein
LEAAGFDFIDENGGGPGVRLRKRQPEPMVDAWRHNGVDTRRAELSDSETSITAANDLAVRRALEVAGVEFIDENGGGPGVRLRKLSQGKQRR